MEDSGLDSDGSSGGMYYQLLGLGACLLSSISFGTMFVPVRKYNAGDGFFVQWCVCSAIFVVGLATYAGRGFPPFQPLAMLGGILWASGNLTAVPIINVIGIGTGQLVWGVVLCCVGWATGRFGLFGTKTNEPSSPLLNYLGVLIVIIGGVLLSFVKKSEQQSENAGDGTPGHNNRASPTTNEDIIRHEEGANLVTTPPHSSDSGEAEDAAIPPKNNQPSPVKARLMAIGLALFAGVCYGVTFTPVIYIQDNPGRFPGASTNGLDYVFPHFCGIYATSTIALVVYVIAKRNKPYVNPQIILPSILCGVLWSMAMLSWFPANDYLSQAITIPINSMLPGCVAASWSVLYFREIKGAANIRFLILAIGVTVTGVILIGLSKMV